MTPGLQAVFAAHNAGSGSPPPPDVLTPQATTISATADQSFSGTVATFTDSNTSIPASGLTATINWGDGTAATTGVVSGSNGSFTVTGSHTYSAGGTDTVAVTLTENSPGTATATADSTADVSSPPPPPPNVTMTATDRNGTTGNVPVITSGSSQTTVGIGTVSQTVASGVDRVSFSNITSETLQLGSGTVDMSFISPRALVVTGGSGTDTIVASSGSNKFTAGTGTLDVTGGSGNAAYFFHAGDGLLKIEDFSSRRDSITVDKSLQGSLQQTSDGHGGVLLELGPAGQGIDLVGVTSFSVSRIHFV